MKLKIQVQNGKLDLIGNGTIIIDGESPTTISIKDNGEPIEMILKFKTNNPISNTPQRTILPSNNKNAFEIIFTDYNSTLGVFNKDLWLIGNAFNRKLYLRYIICAFADTTLKKFEYTFYLGEEITNG